MACNYKHLLSPLPIGNVVLKNRMLGAQGLPHFLQGPETWPADTLITHVSNIARAGAAIVTFSTWSDTDQRRAFVEDAKRFPFFDYTDPSMQNYLSQLADAVHFYDSKLSVNIMPIELPNFQPLVDPTMSTPFELLFGAGPARNVTRDQMSRMIEEAVEKCRLYKNLGFDMVSLHMGWKDFGTHIGLAKFLSPLSNDRDDEYGGDVAGRARLPLEMCRAIKQVCGQDFLIDAQIVGEEEPGGTTVADSIEFAKLAEGLIDILQIRATNQLLCHPTGFNSSREHPVTLDAAAAIKASGTKVMIAPVGGYDDPALNDRLIGEGKVDLVSLSRAFISDPEYGRKILEGRADEIVPCIRCAKCHVTSITGPWLFMCSVNPKAGFEQKIDRMIEPASKKQRVAVIGGGPAGMEAAITAAKHGHDVTLYERGAALGGQLLYAEQPSFKWTIRRFREFLVRETERLGVKVLLNTEATPEAIAEAGFDAVIAATGAEPALPPVPVEDDARVYTPLDAYDFPDSLGKRVVFVGGSETSVETALHLASLGHEVTVLTRQGALASKATPYHYRDIMEDLWNRTADFSYILNAETTAVTADGVRYRDAGGAEHAVEADSVVLCGGVTPRSAEALGFYGSAAKFFMAGDCREQEGNIQKCMRTAFSAASRI